MTRSITVLAILLAALAFSAPAFAGDAAAGKKTYDMLCFTCHGPTGIGDGPAAAALNPPPRNFQVGDFKFDADGNGTPGEDADLMLVITKGAGAFGGNFSMAPWGHMPPSDIEDLVAYVRSLKAE